mgnify:CR=1 FL=1|jgi:hypothetical protein
MGLKSILLGYIVDGEVNHRPVGAVELKVHQATRRDHDDSHIR